MELPGLARESPQVLGLTATKGRIESENCRSVGRRLGFVYSVQSRAVQIESSINKASASSNKR